MEQTELDHRTLTLNGVIISRQVNAEGSAVSEDLKRASVEVAQRARTRMALNECGGLPGLPAVKKGILRRLADRLMRSSLA